MAMPLPQNASSMNEPPEFPPRTDVTDTEHIALYVMLSFFSVLGVIGNAVAFYIFFRRRNSGTSVIFILALAATDFITCLVTVPFSMLFEVLRYDLYYDELCKIYMFFVTSTIPYSSFIMAGIAFDRYFCICHPFLHVFNVQRARVVVLCLAVPAFAFGIITGMFYGIYVVSDFLILNGTVLVGTNISMEMAQHPGHQTPFVNLSDLHLVPHGHVLQRDVSFVNDSHVYMVDVFRVVLRNKECVQNEFYFSGPFQEKFRFVYTSCYAVCFVTVSILYILIYKFIFKRRAMKARRRRNNHHYVSVEAQLPLQNRPPEAETAMTELNGNGSVHTRTLPHLQHHHSLEQATATTSLIEGVAGGSHTAMTTGAGSTAAVAAAATTVASAPVSISDRENSKGRALVGQHTNGMTNVGGVATAGETSRPSKRRGSAARERNLYANIKTAMMLFVVTLVFIVAFAPSWFMAHSVIPIQLNVFYLYFVYNVANPFIYAFMNQAFRDDLKKLLKRS